VLGRFADLYRRQGYKPELKYVEGEDDFYRSPDFRIFSSESPIDDGWDVEITEIQEPGRKRHLEYKSGQNEFDNPSPDPDYQVELTSHVADELGKKFNKAYPTGTWLIAYFQSDKWIYWLLKGPDKGRAFIEAVMRDALRRLSTPRSITQLWICPNPPADYLIEVMNFDA
jgi:hypothetical protein